MGLALAGAACNTPNQTVGLAAGAAALGGYAPTNEIEQIYYLGVFDPQEQVPQTVYRVRVRGQSSFLSATKYASGWVPAAVIDSLGGQVRLDDKCGDVTTKGGEVVPGLASDRRMVVFGPEGFREAPREHRLVIVMGSSPEAFFKGVDEALGTLSRAHVEQLHGEFEKEVLRTLAETGALRAAMAELDRDLARDGGGS